MALSLVARSIGLSKPSLFKRTLIFAGSFDPFALHHESILQKLLGLKELLIKEDPTVPIDVIVWPVGPYKEKTQITTPMDRWAMLKLGLEEYPSVKLNTHDLENDFLGYSSTFDMQRALAFEPKTALTESYHSPLYMPGVLNEIWHVIGADNVDHIRDWEMGPNLWKFARWIIVPREGFTPAKLPSHSHLLDPIPGSCTNIRTDIASGNPWEHAVKPQVAEYIKHYGLYGYRRVA